MTNEPSFDILKDVKKELESAKEDLINSSYNGPEMKRAIWKINFALAGIRAKLQYV